MDTSKQKPDLMGTSRTPQDGTTRILAHLEHGARLPASKPARAAAWTVDGWTVGLVLLLLVMCVAAWLMHDKTVTPERFKAGYGLVGDTRDTDTSRQRGTDGLAHSPTRAPTADTGAYHTGAAIPARDQAAQSEQPAQVEQPAAIVNEPPAHRSADAIGTLASAPPPRPLAPSSPQPAAQAGASAKLPPASTATSARVGTPGALGTAGGTHSMQANAGVRGKSKTADARSKAKPANDTDVTLLTALVAHANQPTAIAPERSRDIVERRDGDNTADLLARCKQLGLIEGMLCRSRICSGRWETDATCRAPAL